MVAKSPPQKAGTMTGAPPAGAVPTGIYRHYKHTKADPKYYLVLGFGRQTETNEYGVVYRPLYATTGPIWQFRPASMFGEAVEVSGQTVPRFVRVGWRFLVVALVAKYRRSLK